MEIKIYLPSEDGQLLSEISFEVLIQLIIVRELMIPNGSKNRYRVLTFSLLSITSRLRCGISDQQH